MANHLTTMVNLQQLIRLKSLGHSNRKVSEILGMSRRTVNHYVQIFDATGKGYATLLSLSTSSLEALLPVVSTTSVSSRYVELSGLLSDYATSLKQTGITYYYLWEKYRSNYPDGYGYTTFKKHLCAYIGSINCSFSHEHKYGEALMVDFAGDRLRIYDKQTRSYVFKEVFVAILPASGYTYAEAVDTQKVEDFIFALQNALDYIGGVPALIIPDNLKSAVIRANRYEPKLNANLQHLALHYNTCIVPARVSKPQDKALVENAVKLVYQRIYAPLHKEKFFDLKSLNQAIRPHLDSHNAKPFQRREGSRLSEFEQFEKQTLNPLAKEKYHMRIYINAKVNKSAMVWFSHDQHHYSVPYRYIGKTVRIEATKDSITVYANNDYKQIAIHDRSKQKGKFTRLPEHMPKTHQWMLERSLENYLQKARGIDQSMQQFFEAVAKQHKHEKAAFNVLDGLLSLRRYYDDERLIIACKRAAHFNNYTYQGVRNILIKNLDRQDYKHNNQQAPRQAHHNIRGAEYYNNK